MVLCARRPEDFISQGSVRGTGGGDCLNSGAASPLFVLEPVPVELV